MCFKVKFGSTVRSLFYYAIREMLIRSFINLNMRISSLIEKLFRFEKNDKLLLKKFFDLFDEYSVIADIGGGKKPAKKIIKKENITVASYDGYDIDLKELKLAGGQYDAIFEVDLTDSSDPIFKKKYDYIVCLNTLEHVQDSTMAIKNISKMLKKGGSLYFKLPCRHALFAKLNLVLPQNFKKKLLYFVFPHKSGDGFEVYYDKSTPNQYRELLERCGLEIQEINFIKWSSYFSFLFPIYFLWRLLTLIQNKIIVDYCESFEIIARHQEVNEVNQDSRRF